MIRLIFRALLGAAALAVTAACGGDKPAASTDTTPAFAAAAEAVTARLSKPGAAPDSSDPAVKAFEDAAMRGMTALGTSALPVDGFNSFDGLCGKAAAVAGAWAALGTAGVAESEKPALMERNVTQYLDQIFTPLLFSAHCAAEHLPFIQTTVSEADLRDKKAAVEQVRGGVYQQVSGLLEMAGSAELDPARKTRIADLLAADAAKFAIVLDAGQRKSIAEMAESVRPALPEPSRAKVDAIKSGLVQAPCGSLCAF
jgi:hypothetical protein